ncbi:hypothetical protein N9A28_08645 [Sulfurimonas sp.]|nr:hypothetical protein [Sulfurimonas sp.]
MEIESTQNNITINGNIKTVSDFQNIRLCVDNIVSNHKQITITITDSVSITSSIIGYLNKLVLKDNIDIQLLIGNEKLMILLDDLNLKSIFNAQRI